MLTKPEFPRSANYDAAWMLDNQMGPNAVWLVEWLTEELTLSPGMRVLDLGCGRAMTSVFLAKEFGLRVWAADLWVGPDQNWQRAAEAGVGDLVCPLRVEAHALPFAQGFFDLVISVDAYQYFGTDDLYLGYLSGFVRPGGQLGVVMPGLTAEFGAAIPAHLTELQANGKAFWEDECRCFHTATWWEAQWRQCNKVEHVRAAVQPEGWRHWRDFEQALATSGKAIFPDDVEALDRDQGRYVGFVRLVAQRNEEKVESLYDPSLGARYGID